MSRKYPVNVSEATYHLLEQPPPRVPRPVQLAAEAPPVDPQETRFGLVLDEVKRDEPSTKEPMVDAPGPA